MLVIGLLVAGFIKADSLSTLAEETTLGGKIVYADTSPYQRIAVTRSRNGFQLYLNNHLQFNSVDEYRYHEALVHPLMGACQQKRDILVLGGGDGLAVREILRYGEIASVTLVDLDPAMTELSTRFQPLVDLNESSLLNQKVSIVNEDAFVWVKECLQQFDAVVVDFPDPGSYSVGKLYTTHFFSSLRPLIRDGGGLAIQCTSPLVAPRSYWCILHSIRASGYDVTPYHASVPTFGIWGFALAQPADRRDPWGMPPTLADSVESLRFLNQPTLDAMFSLPSDQQPVEVPPNRLNDQILVRLYDEEWGHSLN